MNKMTNQFAERLETDAILGVNIKEMEALMLDILMEEVKPATGCTEPVAVSFATASAKAYWAAAVEGTEALKHLKTLTFEALLSNEAMTVEVLVSPNLFKNGLGVGIPNCDARGLQVAAALGLIACEATEGLKVFEVMSPPDVKQAIEFAKSNQLILGIADTDDKIRVEVKLLAAGNCLELILSGRHDRIEKVLFNGLEIFKAAEQSQQAQIDKQLFYDLPIADIVNIVSHMNTEPLRFLMDGLTMNRGVAQAGLDHPLGMGVGYGLSSCVTSGEMGHDLATQAMTLTAAASDARMSGLNMTVMSSNGSGNNGLTAILPLAAYFEKYTVADEQKLRALAMSHLINCYVKNRIGRLSAMCSCAISAATGSGAAIGWLMTGETATVIGTIQNMTGNLSGMICDGAKEGCALKLATGAATGVQAAILASHGVIMPVANGIVGRTAEESIDHLGELSQRGMQLTDGVILDMMKRMV